MTDYEAWGKFEKKLKLSKAEQKLVEVYYSAIRQLEYMAPSRLNKRELAQFQMLLHKSLTH